MEAVEHQYLSFNEVAKETGLTMRMVTKRIEVDQIPVFIDPRDRRRRVIEAKDVARLVELRPAVRQERATA